MGVEMLFLILGIIVLVGGAIGLFKRMMALNVAAIPALVVWLIALIIIVTYAEQHDDPWEQYVANGILSIGTALSGFFAALIVTNSKFQSLNQRLDDHISNEAQVFDQFEKRIMEKSDHLEKRIVEKLDGMAKPRKT